MRSSWLPLKIHCCLEVRIAVSYFPNYYQSSHRTADEAEEQGLFLKQNVSNVRALGLLSNALALSHLLPYTQCKAWKSRLCHS